MATKLKNLEVTKVDFVDQGANPDAHIKLYKRKDGQEPVSEESGGEKGSGILKKLVAFIAKAAGMGEEEIDSAMEEIEKSGAETFSETISRRKNQKIADEIWDVCYALQASLCSILWDEELDSADASAAMKESIDEFCRVVKDSASQWTDGKKVGITKSSGEVTPGELEVMKSARDRLTESIEKVSAAKTGAENKTEGDQDEKVKGDQDMGMKIDKSKLTPSEAAFLSDIEKRYGVDDGTGQSAGDFGDGVKKADTKGKAAGDDGEEEEEEEGGKKKASGDKDKDAVTKALQTLGLGNLQAKEEPEDIYKGLHPAVAAELKSLRKFRQDSEDKELHEVAKRYAIIGKKEEELFPVLKSLKDAGGTAYNDMITILDQAVDTVEKSGAFGEIGKTGGHYNPAYTRPYSAAEPVAKSEHETKVDSIAKKYMEEEPSLGYVQAVAKAWENHPELYTAYEDEAGF